jgi:glycosyltransferase involved in cell wall biosynthesis
MKKIIVLAECNSTGGTGTYLKRILKFLKEDYSVHIVLNKSLADAQLVDFLLQAKISYSLDYSLFPGLDKFLRRVAKVIGLRLFFEYFRDNAIRKRIEWKYRPDLFVISQGGGCNYFAFFNSLKPVILISHSLFTTSIYKYPLGSQFLRLFDKISDRNKKLITVSKYAKNLFVGNFKSKKIASITDFVHNYGERPLGGETRASKVVTTLTLGHVISYKNPELWLDVAIKLSAQYPNKLRFIWAGEGEMLQEMRQKAFPFKNIEFIGFTSEVENLYSETDIYFQPSYWENHSISVLEAMAHGIPCIVSDAGGLPESIDDGIEGFICPIYGVENYNLAFCSLIDSETLRKEMGQNARTRFETFFTKEAWSFRMQEIMRSVLSLS